MNKFTTFAMLICALVATVNCHGGSLAYPVLGGSAAIAGSSVANSPAHIITGPIPVVQTINVGSSYGARPISIAPRRTLHAPVNYGRGHGARVITQPISATVINPGPITYKAYVSPPVHSRVVLPVRASDAVAKVWVPQQSSYGSHGGHGAHGASLGSVY